MSKSIAIIGGGIIGTCTAYYLSRHPKIGSTKIHLFEGSSIAAGASGKAGGFLAKDWHNVRTASLAQLSFKLHEQLSDEFDGESKWAYRRLTTMNVEIDSKRGRTKQVPDAGEWLKSVTKCSLAGTTDTTAQVTPGVFTAVLADAAKEKGVQISIATVTELHEKGDGTREVVAVADNGDRITFIATDVIFAAGPWTGRLAKKLLGDKAGPAANVQPSTCSNSIIIRPAPGSAPISSHALFTVLKLPSGVYGEPEVYPRSDGSVYVCGGGSSSDDPLPEKCSQVKATDEIVQKLKNYAAYVSPDFLDVDGNKATLQAAQACYRPNSGKTGDPVIGKFGEGLWIASGHQVWGINNGPGTGKVLAELMLDGKAISADISALMP
ncbi:hypothetical protein FRC04_011917 [Tulasnella sp. 424]|nr:hypothetical protein FRC04_011917 [Tulasnella sp. 424]KAG8970109.1 hypothetical protein FRC05_000757 [Tulasnella sp. 425]